MKNNEYGLFCSNSYILFKGKWAQLIEPEITYNNCKYILKEE